MDFESILTLLKFKKKGKEDVMERIKLLNDKFAPIRKNTTDVDKVNSIMGQMRSFSEGNLNLTELSKEISSLTK
jgi:glutamyl-tRNA(Gln) amidotransferase subunit E